MLQADVIANRSGSPITALRDLSGRVWALLRPALVAGAQAWAARRDERILMEMPDHLLKDIGLGHSDIRRAVRQGRT